MSWLNNLRNKSYEQRVRFVWIAVAVAGVVLIVIWLLTLRLQKDLPKDTSLFKAIGQGIHNLKQ